MKIKVITGLIFLVALSFSARSEAYTLAVTTVDGQKQQIELNDYPKITMNGGRLVIKSKTATVDFDLQKVADFRYVDAASVNSVVSDQSVIRQGDRLIFKAEDRDLAVSVCDVSGVVVFSRMIQVGDESDFDLSQLAAGVYVVSVNNVSFKIIR